MSPRQYIWGLYRNGNKDFLHSALDEAGVMKYLSEYNQTFPGRYYGYAIYRGDRKIREVLVCPPEK